MFRHLAEKIIKKDLITEFINEVIPCYGYRYLSILTDGAFNPDPTYNNRLNHFVLLKNSNRLIPIYGEMRNIPIGKNAEIHYTNLARDDSDTANPQNGYGYIYFYLSNYINDFMSIKGNIGFQWEKSFTVSSNQEKFYHFGINRINMEHTLAIPFIADVFNKLVYLFKENNGSQVKDIIFLFEGVATQTLALVPDTLTEVLLPCKRFYLHFQANLLNPTDCDMMLKFEKA